MQEIDMNAILESITDWFSFVFIQLQMITVSDVIDILLLTAILYIFGRFFLERRASKLFIGIVIVILIGGIGILTHLYALSYLFRAVKQVGVLALIVLFQPEIRAALEKIGDSVMHSAGRFGRSKDTTRLDAEITALCDAVSDMSRSRTGALIVIERSTKLGDLMETGVIVDAVMSAKLLKNIFFNKAPLHDGAVIIRHMRIAAAGCVLPNSSQGPEVVGNVGTRHRAALGVSEISDAVTIVVSEETGTISIALNAHLHRDYGARTLRHDLLQLLGGRSDVENDLPASEK